MLLARGDNTLDLLKPFADELARLQPGDPQAERVLDAVAAAQLDDPNEAYVMFIGLVQALNDLAPEGSYFGPSVDDPFAFGWWPAQEALMHANAIRQETGRLEPRELARMAPFTPESIAKKKQKDIEAREKAIAKGKEPPVGYAPTLEEKLVEAKESLVQINDLQEAGALFIHNNSGGKDSHAMLIYMIEVLGIPVEQIVSVHADLGRQEWESEKHGKTIDVARRIADHYGVQFEAVEHRRGVSILERLTQRAMTMIVKGKYGPAKPPKAAAPPKKPRKGAKVREVPEWYDPSKYRPGAYELTASPAPSKGQRWCTSEFKTAPCRQMATSLLVERGGHVIVHGLGLRAEESSDRGQQPMLEVVSHTDRSTNFSPPAPLTVYNWLPIQLWTTNEVFRVIEAAGQEAHWIYGEDLTRASCSFCIYSSPEDLTLAAKMRPDLYAEYVAVERTYGKTFTLKRQFLEEMTGVQADEALVAQARERLVPLEQLVEQYGGVLKGKAPETELQKYRQLGFTEEARAEILARPGYAGVYEDEDEDGGEEEDQEDAPAPRERLVSPSLLVRKPLHAQADIPDEEFFESLELVPNAAEMGDFFFGEPPARSMARNAGALPEGFSGFDVFGEEEAPVARSAVGALETQLGEYGSLYDAERLLKPAGVTALKSPEIRGFLRARAWAVEVSATTPGQARNLGERVRRNLVGKRSLSASDPFFHDWTLFVIYDGGVVELEPPIAEPKAKGPSLSDQKHRILYKAKEVFGASGAQLTGGAGHYSLLVKPALKEWRGVFAKTTVHAPTLEELDSKLDSVIAAAEKLRNPLLPNARKTRRGPAQEPTHVDTGELPKVLPPGGRRARRTT